VRYVPNALYRIDVADEAGRPRPPDAPLALRLERH
jgi:hypothetical protein